MKENERLTFWKKLKISITDFDKYQDLAAEKVLRTILYIVVLMSIFAIVVAGIYTYKFAMTISNVKQYINDKIDIITFEENNLNIVSKNGEEVTKIQNDDLKIKVIINTQTDQQKIEESIKEIKGESNGVLILRDKVLLKSEIITSTYDYSYADLAEEYNINKLDKQEVINLLSSETIKPLIAVFFVMIFIYMFILYFSSALVDIIVLSVFGYLVSLITKMKLKYSAVYNIAAYSLTLPIILNIIYFVVNSFTGFTIQYFDIMYTTVATIYIATAILMIRSDVIKKQIQLTQIIEEQEKVRQEIEKQEEEKRQQEEKEKQKKDDENEEKEKRKKKKEKEDGKDIGKEPEGNNV